MDLRNCDNMDLMREFPDKYFDLAIVDPPYGIDGNSHRNNQSRGKVCKSKAYDPELWNQAVPTIDYFKELFRVSKNQIIFGANHFIDLIPYRSSCWLVWDKVNDGTDFADCELAWTSFKTSVRRLRFQWSGMLQGDMKNKEVRIHPTQKPVKLYKWILENYAVPGNKILDTHLGGGSIAIAAHDYGYDLTASEIHPKYYNDALKRLKNHTDQLKLAM